MKEMALSHDEVDVKPGSCVKKPVFALSDRTSITGLPSPEFGCSTCRVEPRVGRDPLG